MEFMVFNHDLDIQSGDNLGNLSTLNGCHDDAQQKIVYVCLQNDEVRCFAWLWAVTISDDVILTRYHRRRSSHQSPSSSTRFRVASKAARLSSRQRRAISCLKAVSTTAEMLMLFSFASAISCSLTNTLSGFLVVWSRFFIRIIYAHKITV
jgi:hypothetical protein